MKLIISDLIKIIDKFQKQYGDLEVGVPVYSTGKINRLYFYITNDPKYPSEKIVTFNIYG